MATNAMPITDALYGREAEQRRRRPHKERKPPREHGTPIGQMCSEATLRKLSRKYRCVRKYLA